MMRDARRDIAIVPAGPEHAEGLCAALNAVVREGKYLSTNSEFSLDSVASFSENCREKGYPQLAALDAETGAVVGWCDIIPRVNMPTNIGFLGVGIIEPYRGQGHGRALIARAISEANSAGFREIRLDCRASNTRAIALYKKLGFRKYAYIKHGIIIEKVTIPIVCMKISMRKWIKRNNKKG